MACPTRMGHWNTSPLWIEVRTRLQRGWKSLSALAVTGIHKGTKSEIATACRQMAAAAFDRRLLPAVSRLFLVGVVRWMFISQTP